MIRHLDAVHRTAFGIAPLLLAAALLAPGCDSDSDPKNVGAPVTFTIYDGRGNGLEGVEAFVGAENDAEESSDSSGELTVRLEDGEEITFKADGFIPTSWRNNWSDPGITDVHLYAEVTGFAAVTGQLTNVQSTSETAHVACSAADWNTTIYNTLELEDSPQDYEATCYGGSNTLMVFPDSIFFDDPDDAFFGLAEEVDADDGDATDGVDIEVVYGGKNFDLEVSGGFSGRTVNAGYHIFPGMEAFGWHGAVIDGSSGSADVTVPVNDELTDARFWLAASSTTEAIGETAAYGFRYSRIEFDHGEFLDLDSSQEIELENFDLDDVSPAAGDSGVSTDASVSFTVGSPGDALFTEIYLHELQNDGWYKPVWYGAVNIALDEISIPEGVLRPGTSYRMNIWTIALDNTGYYENDSLELSGYGNVDFDTE